MLEHCFSEEVLIKIMYDCMNYHLSDDELNVFILEYYMRREDRINKRLQV